MVARPTPSLRSAGRCSGLVKVKENLEDPQRLLLDI
jgi:hypothetical protein